MLPHDQVVTRLAPSPIDGVGVFATEQIKAGTNLFEHDDEAIRWISAVQVERLGPSQRALYDDFAIRREGLFGCPDNFNLLTVGWYCNEPAAGQTANARMTPNLKIVAARDIATDEEITLDYSTFSD
jgi:hypothetical protein